MLRLRINRVFHDFFKVEPDPTIMDAPINLTVLSLALDFNSQAVSVANTINASDSKLNLNFAFASGATAEFEIDLSGIDYDTYGWQVPDGSIKTSPRHRQKPH